MINKNTITSNIINTNIKISWYQLAKLINDYKLNIKIKNLLVLYHEVIEEIYDDIIDNIQSFTDKIIGNMYSFSMYFNHHNSKVQKNALLKITKCNQTNYLELCNRKNEIKELKTNLNEDVNAQQIKILEMKIKDLQILYLDEISKKD